MSRRSYAGGARAVQLTAPVDASLTTLVWPITLPVNWPDDATGPFSVVVDRDETNEEKGLCSDSSGGFLTFVVRGYDGTSPMAHDVNAKIEVIGTAIDFDEANAHVNASTDVHGLSGGDRVVGESRAATLTNKSISGLTNTFSNIPLSASVEIGNEIADLHGDDVVLQSNIDAEASARSSADSTEAATRASADATLQANINAEASARSATDATLAPQATTYTKTEVDVKVAAVTPKIPSDEVAVTANTTGVSGTLATLGPYTFDGATEVDLRFTCDSIQGSQDDNRFSVFIEADADGTYRGSNQFRCKWNTDNDQRPVFVRARMTPSAGAHTFRVKWTRSVGSGNATFNMNTGAGGLPGPGIFSIESTR